ncbi:ankyrin repeat-containing domain protein [Tricharina praecox]|uniref:ankyrin repeat-containing domain protein n=1 Tax=Tricharina praecox TaxID=43433 RepID=UPI00221F6962|nr:ankyrin repeat-containing domain protein [Tricharina praecox]KAI5853607.1 ankyrin repeat-containing domain protein [Tricharina praecox]
MLLSLPLELVLLVLENLDLPSLADFLSISPSLTASITAIAPSLVTKQPTLLHLAASRNHPALLSHLLTLLPATTLDSRKHTPLYRAAESGALATLQLLLSRGTVEPVRRFASETPLTVAARRGHLSAVSLLLPTSAASIGKALIAASGAGQTSVASLLLSPTPPHSVLSSALCAAAAAGSHEILSLLQSAGAKPGTADADGSTPLHHAARAGRTEIVALLLWGQNVKLDAQDAHGWTPLHWATFAGFEDVKEMLVVAGADVEVVNDDGVPAGGWPVEQQVEVVEGNVGTEAVVTEGRAVEQAWVVAVSA